MTFKEKLAAYSAADIMEALGCARGTAYDWKDGRREPPDWQQPHWLEILERWAKKRPKKPS